MITPSLCGSLYVMTFVDDMTRYVWTYVVKKNSEVFGKFQEWKAEAEKKRGTKLKTLKSGNCEEIQFIRV